MPLGSSLAVYDVDVGRPVLGRWWRPSWPLYLALALLFGAYSGLKQLLGTGSPIAVWKPFVWEYSSVLVIVPLIPVIVRLEHRFRLDGQPRGPIIAAHVAAAKPDSTNVTTNDAAFSNAIAPSGVSTNVPR